MRKNLYAKLALINIKNHRRLFVPFMLSCAGCVAMFFIMLTLMDNNDNIMSQGGASTLGFVMELGCIVVGFFSVFIVLYANSYIIKRRKKELGLYNILGMEKRHIARVLAFESVITSFASIIIGIVFAALFSRLLALILYKIIGVATLTRFTLSVRAVYVTLTLFACIFLATYLWNVSRISFSSGIELLRGSDVGEREPKTKHFITIIGVLSLGYAYYLALSTKDPALAILLFFVAVILVIIGTYCLFTSGSIALLKALKRNKSYYYKPNHFTSVSGMIYRMKQNAVGLANICILSTMVLVMLSSTTCLYGSIDSTVRLQFPRDITLNVTGLSDESAKDLSEYLEIVKRDYAGIYENPVSYRYVEDELKFSGDKLTSIDYSKDFVDFLSRVSLFLIPLDDYVAMQPNGQAWLREDDEVLVYSAVEPYDYDKISFGNEVYGVTKLDEMYVDEYYSPAGSFVLYVIVPDTGDFESITSAVGSKYDGYNLRWAFDVVSKDADQISILDGIRERVKAYMASREDLYGNSSISTSCAQNVKAEYMGVYGGLLFLGIFLGLMFTMAAALIMYYRQISEGYDDNGRYEIMRNVGMSLKEVASSIRSQVMTVFLLPLAAAGLHITMAFPMITTMFRLLRLTNVALFTQSTLICLATFAVIYLCVYALTARTYYRIVSRPIL